MCQKTLVTPYLLVSTFLLCAFHSILASEEVSLPWKHFTTEILPLPDSIETPESETIQLFDSSASSAESAEANEQMIELAKALDNNPVKIFNYVRNNIHYQHYHGIRKGATLTLLEGGGNDFDQCALLAELLKAANFTNIRYRVRGQRIFYEDLIAWIGLANEPFPGKTFEDLTGSAPTGVWSDASQLVLKRALFAQYFLNKGGSVSARGGAIPVTDFPEFPNKAQVVYDRMYLEVEINGTTYDLDPSYKLYEEIDGIEGILTSIGYSRADLLSAAGGSTGTGYVKSLSSANVETNLQILNRDLLDFLAQNHHDLSLQELISGRRIIVQNISNLDEGFPLARKFVGTNVSDTALPEVYKTRIRFIGGGIDYSIPMADLEGRKITLTFNGNTADIRLDDSAPVASTTVSGSSINLETRVTHHGHLGTQTDSVSGPKVYRKHDTYAYTILYGFKPSGKLLQQRFERLNRYQEEGLADDSREVRTELLNIMGLTWLHQTELVNRVLARQNECININHHRIGRMSQEAGFFVDIGLQFGGFLTRDGVRDDGRQDNSIQLGQLIGSALEHGVIEQMQKDASAVSTVNILRKANAEGQKIYLADVSNWNSSVKSKIDDHYSSSLVSQFTNLINNAGARIFLPYNDNVSQGDWVGSGWVQRTPSAAGMIIDGGYSGGYSTNHGYVSSPRISSSSYYNPAYIYTAPNLPSNKPFVAPNLSTPSFFGSDPVDMSNGAFTFAHTDMSTGVEEAPRGLSFSRYYSSNRAGDDSQHLGHGWTHALHIRAVERTATEESLGLGTIQQVAPLLTSILVGQDLYRADASAKEWGVATLAVGWFVDQMKNNGVSITIGHNAFQFMKQPDGSYQAPAGSTMSLEKVSGAYRLKQRYGNTIYFENTSDANDEAQRVQKIVDIDGKEMTFHYHSDDRIDYVQDAYGRRYTFSYYASGAAEDYIQRVTDSTDNRFVEFRYDSEGNLDRVTDPEGNFFYFDHEIPAGETPVDPSNTTADQHRIVRLRNHDNQIVTQNVFDPLGRVSEQYLHGDTTKTWKLRYTGLANTEEDPEGGITTYCYDERGRACGKIDASGKESSWEYDGQDRIVKQTSGTGEVTIKKFDKDHNLLRVDHPRGAGSTVYQYDALHRIDLVTDPELNETDYVYHTSGPNQNHNRPYQVIDEAGTTTYQYIASGAAQGKLWKVTDHNNLTTEHAYDSLGHPDWTKAPGGILTDYNYTVRGDLDYVDDAKNIRTDYTYNKRRQVTKVESDKNGSVAVVSEQSYNNQALPESSTEAVDHDGQRVRSRSQYSATEKLTHSYLENDTATLDDDLIGENRLDGRDWVTKALDASQRASNTIYFANGEVDKQIAPGNRTSHFTSDNDGRPLSSKVPGANTGDRTRGFSYGVSDQAEGDQTTGYPKTTFTDADGKSTTSETDRNGQLRFYTNKKGNVFEFRYDGLGRRTHIITPLDAENGRAHVTAYTHRGPPTLITEPSGDSATFGYHPTNGRLQTLTYSGVGGGVVRYDHPDSYDVVGNLQHLSEGSQHVYRSYDNLNRVNSYTGANNQQIGYRFYPSGRLAKIIYPGGTENGVGHVEYKYWKTGRLKQVIDKLDSVSSPRTTTYYWRNDGRLESVDRPNGTERTVRYDPEGRPDLVQEFSSTGQLIHLSKLGYYPSDELEWTYTLPKAPLMQRKAVLPITSATYRSDNSLETFNGVSVSHDADGNLTYGHLPDGSLGNYVYDSRNRLKSAGGLSYGYCPEGTRLTSSEDGGTTYVTDTNLGLSKVLQRTKNGETVRYVWGLGLQYEVDQSGATTTYHYNSSGSTVALTNDAQQVIERMDYSPFGQTTYRESLDGDNVLHDTPFLFTGFFGNQTDSNGLIYMRARYYNPLLRRFINSDPAREAWNWYGYAGGNPIGFVDPTGLGISGALDAVQNTLSFLGMVPVAGNAFDAVNVGISLARGNYGDAALSVAAALPGIGLAAGGARVGVNAVKSSNTVIRRIPNPSTRTGVGFGVTDPPVRIQGPWRKEDIFNGLNGRPPRTLGRPDLHHADQMPGSAIHEVYPNVHRGNSALHPNLRNNQGVTDRMRAQDRQLHWWYRAREQGADSIYPDLIYDN